MTTVMSLEPGPGYELVPLKVSRNLTDEDTWLSRWRWLGADYGWVQRRVHQGKSEERLLRRPGLRTSSNWTASVCNNGFDDYIIIT